ISSNATSSPSALKKPRSTAAIAGKYEFDMTSGIAIFIVRTAAGVGLRVGKSCRSELDRSRATLHGNHRTPKEKLACPRRIGRNFAEFGEIALSFLWILRLKPFFVRDRLLLDEFARHGATLQTVKIQETFWSAVENFE